MRSTADRSGEGCFRGREKLIWVGGISSNRDSQIELRESGCFHQKRNCELDRSL